MLNTLTNHPNHYSPAINAFSEPTYRPVIGRFAPSPTGELHLGSLTTAIASYCHIKSLDGCWLLRIEDTDFARCSQQFSSQILIDLERLGLQWDGQVTYQSERTDIYNDLLHTRLAKRIYGCTCSRKQLQTFKTYPRFCLRPHPNVGVKNLNNVKVRIQLPNYYFGFLDHLQGMQWVNPQLTLGDVVLRRADGIVNYFLAASIDDGLQGVTHVMRGLDILPLTTAQIAITHYLDLPTPEAWYHLPLVTNTQGQKLSKQNLATPIDTSSREKCQRLIHHGLRLLKQPTVDTDTPRKMLAQAAQQWQNQPLKNYAVLGCAE